MFGWKAPSGPKKYRYTPYNADIKDEVDHKEYMTPVKNQGSCGSCWSFAATESLESGYAMANKKAPIELSPQQFVDCTREPQYGSEGCNGGWMDDVFDYVKNISVSVCTEKEYPYTARDGHCQEEKCHIKLGVTGRVNIREGDINGLLQALEKTPVSIAIDASPMSWYSSGVLEIKTAELNHGVLATGYNKAVKKPYIIVRNSWGARWGDKGYVHVSIEHNGGATIAASYPEFGDKISLPGLTACKSGEMPDAAKNCMCTYGEACDKKKPHGKNQDGCDDDCGCGEFGYCR